MKLGFDVKVTINGRACIGEAIQPPPAEREFAEAQMCWLYWIRQCQWERAIIEQVRAHTESEAA